MSAVTHSFAYLRNLPFACGAIQPTGVSALASCRVIGPVNEKPRRRIEEFDLNENAQQAGELHDDLEREIDFKLAIPSNFVVPGLHTTLAIATGGPLTNRYAGNWKIKDIPIAWTAGKMTIISVVAVKQEYYDYVVA